MVAVGQLILLVWLRCAMPSRYPDLQLEWDSKFDGVYVHVDTPGLHIHGPLREGDERSAVPALEIESDPCTVRTDDVPCLHVPACADGRGAFGPFRLSTLKQNILAAQKTTGNICWDNQGLHVTEVAREKHVFSPYTQCNSPVFSQSNVLEVFIAPVLHVTDNPEWYFELDASPSGAMWGGLTNNSRGNASTCLAVDGCAGPCGIGTCLLPCEGLARFEHNLTAFARNVTGGYEMTMSIPWALFQPTFRPEETRPWKLWRANFYRYGYPGGAEAPYNLSAWSPTREGSFHVPEKFGVVVLDDEVGHADKDR